jgi:hypothetical protein
MPGLRHLVNAVLGPTLLGLLVAAISGCRVRRAPHGLLVASGYRLPLPSASAFTIGDVVLTRYSYAELMARPRLLLHEYRHSVQWACWLGLPFLLAYGAASLWSQLLAGNPWQRNVFEVRAGLADGGYVSDATSGR